MRMELSMKSWTDDCQVRRREIQQCAPNKFVAVSLGVGRIAPSGSGGKYDQTNRLHRERPAMFKRIALATAALALAPAAWALESAQAHVTIVESTYMPGSITFQVDIGTPSCPAGAWLTWSNANVDNVKSAFALLIAATNSGNRVGYFINNGDTTCAVQFLHALSS